MNTTDTTTTPENRAHYRAALDLVISLGLKGEKMTFDKACSIIDAINLVNSEAWTRGYETARDSYKSY